jgi:hypothetical protein
MEGRMAGRSEREEGRGGLDGQDMTNSKEHV